MTDIVKVEKPAPGKSWTDVFAQRAQAQIVQAQPSTMSIGAVLAPYAREGVSTLATYAEGGTVGGLLGTTDATFGLDTPVGPIDAWLAALGAVAAIGLAGVMPGAAAHARTVGGQALAVLAYRRSRELVSDSPLSPRRSIRVQRTTTVSSGDDPIIAAARGM